MSTSVLAMDVKTLLYSELQIGNIIKRLSTSVNKQETDKAIAKGIELVMYWANIRTPQIKASVQKAMQVGMPNWVNEFNAFDVMSNPQMYATNIVENALMLVFREIKKLSKTMRSRIKVIEKGLKLYMKEYQRTGGVIVGNKVYSDLFKTLNELPKEEIALFELTMLLELVHMESKEPYNDQNRQMNIHMIMQNLYGLITNIKMVV